MNQNRDNAVLLLVVLVILLGPHDPFHHGIDQFQMAGVGAQADVDGAILVVVGRSLA